jgi:hypothetical protein
MTTPWRSVQDAEKANQTVAWQALPCRLSGGRVSEHRKVALAHVIPRSRRNGAKGDARAVPEDVGVSPDLTRAEGESG